MGEKGEGEIEMESEGERMRRGDYNRASSLVRPVRMHTSMFG